MHHMHDHSRSRFIIFSFQTSRNATAYTVYALNVDDYRVVNIVSSQCGMLYYHLSCQFTFGGSSLSFFLQYYFSLPHLALLMKKQNLSFYIGCVIDVSNHGVACSCHIIRFFQRLSRLFLITKSQNIGFIFCFKLQYNTQPTRLILWHFTSLATFSKDVIMGSMIVILHDQQLHNLASWTIILTVVNYEFLIFHLPQICYSLTPETARLKIVLTCIYNY